MIIDNEKSRTYYWLTQNGAPAMKIDFPADISFDDGTHRVVDNEGRIFVLRNWDVYRTEPLESLLVKEAT